MAEEFAVINNKEESRFEVDLGDAIALVDYKIAGPNIIYTHTEVPIGYEGRGIAKKMAYEAMEYAKNEGLKVQALCPYIKKYVTEHSEYHGITWGFTKRS